MSIESLSTPPRAFFLSFFLLERISWYQEGRGSRRLINWLLGKTIECIFNGKKGGELFLRRNIKTAPGDECTCWHELTTVLWSRELASRSESAVILLIVGFSLSQGKDGFFKVVVFLKKSLFSSFSMQALSTCQKPSAPKVTSKHVADITFDGFSIIFIRGCSTVLFSVFGFTGLY